MLKLGLAVSFLLLILFFGGAYQSDRHSLSSAIIASSGPFACDPTEMPASRLTQHRIAWVNGTETKRHVTKVEVWLGANRDAVIDQWVFMGSNEKVFGHTNWDRYANPTGPHNLSWSFGMDVMEVWPEETVWIRYGCRDVAGGRSYGDVVVTAWWW